MDDEHNYVECSHCSYWNFGRRLHQVCKACNNTRKTIDPKEFLCNLCGGQLRHLATANEQYPCGLEASVTGGYDSYHLFDNTTYIFNLCEKCLRELFIKCVIKPQVTDTLSPDFEGWEADQKAYEYRIWCDTGGSHQAYVNGKCNTIKDCPNKALYTILSGSIGFSEDCACEEHKSRYDYPRSCYKLTKFIPNVLKPFL